MKEKVAKSMTIEKNVNLDLKEGICTEKNFWSTFYNVKNKFSYKQSYFLSSCFFTVHVVCITIFKAESNSWVQSGHPVKKLGQYLEVYFQNDVFTVYALFFLLNLSLNLSDFLGKPVDFIPILTLIQWFLYILSDAGHKYQDFL